MAMIAGLTMAIMKFMPDSMKDSLRYPITQETLDGARANDLACVDIMSNLLPWCVTILIL